jgi:hypothetical protein
MSRQRLLLAVSTAVVALTVGCGGSDKTNGTGATSSSPTRATPVTATPASLRALAGTVGHDIFWAGAKSGYTYELTQTKSGDIYIRYLSPGVPVGAAGADFLSVGTYSQPDAFATIRAAEKRPGEIVHKIDAGGVAVASPQRPQSVYFAYPGSKLLVEVYDPNAARALRLVTGLHIVPIR